MSNPASASALMYQPQRPSRSLHLSLRGGTHHVRLWGEPSQATPEQPPLVLAHGWMDVGASFQFLVDELARLEGTERCILALDWRGFGLSAGPAGADAYWFPDYLGDLEAILRAPELGLDATKPIDLVGHSMGGNVVMLYAGVRPERVRRLVNLEGFGLPAGRPEDAGRRYAKWLDELTEPMRLRDFDSAEAVAARLIANSPALRPDRAAWLAREWAEPSEGDDGGPDRRWRIRGDAAHKRVNPQLYRVEEILTIWRAITAPVLWVEGEHTDLAQWWGTRYPRAEFDARWAELSAPNRQVKLTDCGHMMHLEQPEALAAALRHFLTESPGA